MNQSDISEKISEIIAERTDYSTEDLTDKRGALLHTDLKIDSLTILDIALSIDQEFQTDFTEEELFGMQTIDKATAMIQERLAEKG